METSSTYSSVDFEIAKSEIPNNISKLRERLESIAEISENVRKTTNKESLEFLLMITDGLFIQANHLRDSIKMLSDSVGK